MSYAPILWDVYTGLWDIYTATAARGVEQLSLPFTIFYHTDLIP